MKIWVDADACPKVVKEVLCRAATRTGLQITFVANHYVPVPTAPNIKIGRASCRERVFRAV